jgi:hypothetical protein
MNSEIFSVDGQTIVLPDLDVTSHATFNKDLTILSVNFEIGGVTTTHIFTITRHRIRSRHFEATLMTIIEGNLLELRMTTTATQMVIRADRNQILRFETPNPQGDNLYTLVKDSIVLAFYYENPFTGGG